MIIPLSPHVPENLVSRNGFSRPVPRQPAHLHTQAESGAYLRESSRVPRRRPFTYLKPPYAIGSVPSSSGHAIAYRWRSLPRVRLHQASKPQGSSERVPSWQVTMDQLICASLSINTGSSVDASRELFSRILLLSSVLHGLLYNTMHGFLTRLSWRFLPYLFCLKKSWALTLLHRSTLFLISRFLLLFIVECRFNTVWL